MAKLLRDRYFWLIVALLVLAGVLMYPAESYILGWLPAQGELYLTLMTFQRVMFLIIVAIAAWKFGLKGGLSVGLAIGLIVLPRVIEITIGQGRLDLLAEYMVMGAISVIFSWLVSTRKRTEENLHYYLQEITKAQEEERGRIARELHDGTAQNLIALLHQLDNFLSDQTKLSAREAKVLWGLHKRLRDVLQEVRRFSRNLRPSILDDLGLLPALEWITGELKTEYGVEVSFEVVGSKQRLSREAELLLFRIVQEALMNIAKHAQASKAEVKVKFDKDKIKVAISDNGIGFQLPENLGALPQTGKLGLAGMQERIQLLGASLEIQSELGCGTKVFIEAPI